MTVVKFALMSSLPLCVVCDFSAFLTFLAFFPGVLASTGSEMCHELASDEMTVNVYA